MRPASPVPRVPTGTTGWRRQTWRRWGGAKLHSSLGFGGSGAGRPPRPVPLSRRSGARTARSLRAPRAGWLRTRSSQPLALPGLALRRQVLWGGRRFPCAFCCAVVCPKACWKGVANLNSLCGCNLTLDAHGFRLCVRLLK